MQYDLDRRVKRARVPIQVIRGENPTEPVRLSSLAPPIDDEEIRSGMVLVKDTGLVNGANTDGAFRKTVAATDSLVATNEHTSYFIARHDQDSHDVQQAGGLVGLDCSDDYEIQSGYFDKEVTYQLDTPLTADDDGEITEATAGTVIIGYITKIGSGTGNSLPYVGKTPSTGTLANAEVIQFKTARNGQSVSA